MSANKWLYDYDKASLEKRFIHELNLLLFYDSIPKEKASNIPYITFSLEPVPLLLQKKLLEFLEFFQQSFEEMAGLQEVKYQAFSRIGFLFINCEKFYVQEAWRPYNKESKDIFIRLMASFIRVQRLLHSLHKTLFVNKETPALFLRALQGMLVEGLDNVLANVNNKNEFFTRDLFLNIFQKMRHYCKGFLSKPHELLLQETVNLFGEDAEKSLLPRINELNNRILSQNNSSNELNPKGFGSNSNEMDEGSVENAMKLSIMKGLSSFFHEDYSIHELPELRQFNQSAQTSTKHKKKNQSPSKKQLNSLFDEKVFQNYPCLNEEMNKNMLAALQELEEIERFYRSTQENLLKSCKNSQDLPSIFQSQATTTKEIKNEVSLEEIPLENANNNSEFNNNSDIINDDDKTNEEKEFTQVADLDLNIEIMKKQHEKKKLFHSPGKLMLSHSFQVEEKDPKALKKKKSPLANSHSFQIEEDLQKNMRNSSTNSLKKCTISPANQQTGLLAPPKLSAFGLTSPKGKNESRKRFNLFGKKSRKAEKAKTNILSQKLNVSVRDVIKIDSNTLISEELRHVEFIESDGGFLIRDSELFQEEEEDLLRKNASFAGTQRTFLNFFEKAREEEMIKGEGLYFRIGANKNKNSGNFIRRIQIHQEVQSVLNKKFRDKMVVERKAGYWDKFVSWGFKPKILNEMFEFF